MNDASLAHRPIELDEQLVVQFTGQREVRNLAEADGLCAGAKAAHDKARHDVSSARSRERGLRCIVGSAERCQRTREWCSRYGFPLGIWALARASLLYLLVVPLLLLIHFGPTTFAMLSVATVLGLWGMHWRFLAGSKWLKEIANLDGRRQQLADAHAVTETAREAAKEPAKRYLEAQALCQNLRKVIQSEAQRKVDEANLRRQAIEANRQRLVAVNIDVLSGHAFEQFLVDVFRHLGYGVEHTGQSGDQGVDLIVTVDEHRIAVQAKRYETTVGNWAVQEAFTGMHYHHCHHCAVVTNSQFTRSAEEAAAEVGCQLIAGDQIRALISGEIVLATKEARPAGSAQEAQ